METGEASKRADARHRTDRSHQGEDVHHLREFGHLEDVVHVDFEFVPRVLQKPRIHQYMKNGRIHRSRHERPVDQFELFLDLLMVGVVHQLADASAESVTGISIVRFLLTFWGAWSIWTDYRDFVNISGLDDLPQRLYTFLVMAMLLGYTSNATGIQLDQAEYAADKAPIKGTIGFFLAAKLVRFILYAFYGLYLHEFFLSHLAMVVRTLVAAGLYLGALFAPQLYQCAVLFGVGGLVEIVGPLAKGPFSGNLNKQSHDEHVHLVNIRGRRLVKASAIPIMNIEHLSERNGAFFTIVLGESVASVIYNVEKYRQAAGINKFYGRAFMVLMVAFCFNWLYFTRDWNVKKRHPIRRHWLTAWLYNNVHWPLCGSLILASAGVSRMVSLSDTRVAIRWYWGGGVATALTCLTALDLMYQWDYFTKVRALVLFTRVFFRVAVVVISVLVPLANLYDDLKFLGLYAGLYAFLVSEELLGKVIVVKQTEWDWEADLRKEQQGSKHDEEHNVSQYYDTHHHVSDDVDYGVTQRSGGHDDDVSSLSV